MGKVINVTAANIDLCDDALKALRLHLDRLAQMTREYPVECCFGRYSFLFESREDIESLIANLDAKISDYYRQKVDTAHRSANLVVLS